MLYLLWFLLNIGSPILSIDNTFIGKWELIQVSDMDDPTDIEKMEGITLDIYSDGKLTVIDDGDVESRDWKIINGVFYIYDGDEKEPVNIKYEGDKMIWEYEGEILVFRRRK